MGIVLDRQMALVLALLAGGCATVSVKTDSDPTVDFSRYRTVQVLGGRLIVDGDSDDGNTLVKDRITKEIVANLTAKGLQPVPSGGDLLATFVAGARKVTEIEAVGSWDGLGPFWGRREWWGPVYYDWWTREYVKGTLVIDLIDAATKKLVWRAYTEADIKSPDAADLIAKAVRKAFARYPPASK